MKNIVQMSILNFEAEVQGFVSYEVQAQVGTKEIKTVQNLLTKPYSFNDSSELLQSKRDVLNELKMVLLELGFSNKEVMKHIQACKTYNGL